MGKLIHITVLCMGLTTCLYAQSAANFNTRSVVPSAPSPKEPAPAQPLPKQAGPLNATPSRNVGPDEMDAYLESISSLFSSRTRESDPFGQLQDPAAKPVIKASTARASNRPAPVQATPFPEIIGMIKITTVMPGTKRFLIGNRSVKQGDQIPLIFRNNQIRIEVLDVTSRQIDFKNLETGETASHRLEMLPVGMTPGNQGITAPGMVPVEQNTPIQLEVGQP